MTWEQELKIQSKEIAEKIAPIMAKNMAEGMVQKNAIETAKNFLENGTDANLVAKCTGLSLEQVLALQKEVTASVTQ